MEKHVKKNPTEKETEKTEFFFLKVEKTEKSFAEVYEDNFSTKSLTQRNMEIVKIPRKS